MKKHFTLLLILGISLMSTIVCAQQLQVTIAGDTCENNSLHATISSGDMREIRWFKDNVLLQARGPWQRSGTVVAGSASSGQAANQLYDPHGVFVDKKKNIYVVDNTRVQKWAPGATSGVTVAGGTSKGTALNLFYSPVDVVVDDLGNLYVTDYLTNSVRKWAPGATSGTIVAGGNGAGAQLNQFNGPQGIARDAQGNLYIADRWNDRVMKWAPGATAGVVVAGGNGRGAAANQLREPFGVGVDSNGNIYVSDPYNNRVMRWAPGAGTGVVAAGGNGAGPYANQLNFPNAIRVNGQGVLYIMDSGRLIKWKYGAAYGMVIAGGYGRPTNAGEMDKIGTSWGIAIDANENAYVSDLSYARVLRFLKTSFTDGEIANVTAGNYTAKVISTLTNSTVTSAVFGVKSKPPIPVIKGNGSAEVNTVNEYKIETPFPGATYTWTVPSGSTVLAGQGTPVISVKFGTSSGRISVVASNSCGAAAPKNKTVNLITGYSVIYGNDCEGQTLYGAVSLGQVNQYLWFKDSVLVAASGKGDAAGTVIAGGNGQGSAPNQLYQPYGIFVIRSKLYIVDATNYRVQQWPIGSTEGVTVAGGHGKGTALNQFASARDVAVDSAGNVYVSDALAHRVVKWAPKATSGVVVAGGNGAGRAANQLNGPEAIFLDNMGNLYIADRWNHRVQKWARGATAGVTVAGGNGSGTAANQLSEATGVSVDRMGNVYVSDLNNFRVQKWAPGASAGITVAGGNGSGKAPNQLSAPWKVRLDSLGNIFVLDNNRVQKWLVGSAYGLTVANNNAVATDGSALPLASNSFGLFVDSKSNIYISDIFEARVRRFRTANAPALATLPDARPGIYTLKAIIADGRIFDSKPFKVIEIPLRPKAIVGPATVKKNSIVTYSVKDPSPNAQYNWTVPADAEIQSGWSTSSIKVKWGTNSGEVSVFGSNHCGASAPRVKIITVALDEPVALRTTSAPTITLYPNPTTDAASVLFESIASTPYEITVMSIMGKLLMTKSGQANAGQNKVDISVGNLNNNIYIVNLKHQGTVTVLKLSKQAL